jgi:hypothetical protein
LWNLNAIRKRAVYDSSQNARGDLVALLDHERDEARDAGIKGNPLLSNDTELIIPPEVSDLGVTLGKLLRDLPSIETSEGASQPGTLFCKTIQHHIFANRTGITAALCHTVWSHNQ